MKQTRIFFMAVVICCAATLNADSLGKDMEKYVFISQKPTSYLTKIIGDSPSYKAVLRTSLPPLNLKNGEQYLGVDFIFIEGKLQKVQIQISYYDYKNDKLLYEVDSEIKNYVLRLNSLNNEAKFIYTKKNKQIDKDKSYYFEIEYIKASKNKPIKKELLFNIYHIPWGENLPKLLSHLEQKTFGIVAIGLIRKEFDAGKYKFKYCQLQYYLTLDGRKVESVSFAVHDLYNSDKKIKKFYKEVQETGTKQAGQKNVIKIQKGEKFYLLKSTAAFINMAPYEYGALQKVKGRIYNNLNLSVKSDSSKDFLMLYVPFIDEKDYWNLTSVKSQEPAATQPSQDAPKTE